MKLSVGFFLSYAHGDRADVERFRTVLEPLLKTSSKFQFGGWSDHQILPGEHWRAEIEQALGSARFGLLLVSPGFLASEFITKEELPPLLAKPMVVPVELQRILLDGTMDLKGLDGRHVFHDSKGRSFDECRAMPARRDFARELFTRIVALLEKYPC
ncbi:MAG: toll/interleukin-1 receptor domain-containing protein [Acidobacteriia bacterium]|nr:toll/interleukin-1 receptor domain-containing protein [Terriglobia bacterium]